MGGEVSEQFFYGATALGALVAATHFLRFYKVGSDRLLMCFSVAFVLIGAQAVILSTHAPQPIAFAMRLLAFLIILVGIIDKNQRAKKK
jgi:hypothetical protein